MTNYIYIYILNEHKNKDSHQSLVKDYCSEFKHLGPRLVLNSPRAPHLLTDISSRSNFRRKILLSRSSGSY